MPYLIDVTGIEFTYLKRGLDESLPWAGDPAGQELNSQGDVRGVAGTSEEPYKR